MRVIIREGLAAIGPDHVIQADIGIHNGVIESVSRGRDRLDYDQEVDAAECWVLPGGIDAHVHLDWDFGDTVTTDDMNTGTLAAAFGGTTTVLNFIQPQPGESLKSLINRWRDKGREAWTHYGYHVVMSAMDAGWTDELPLLPSWGIHSIKVFTAYPGKLMLSDADLYRVLRLAGKSRLLTMVHAENGPVIDVIAEESIAEGKFQPRYHGTTRPTALEGEAVYRAGQIARVADASAYFVHLSSLEAVQALEYARLQGGRLAAETCPQYLFLEDEVYQSDDFDVAQYVYTPPSRPGPDVTALWDALRRGDIGIVSSDHCPFDLHGAKKLGEKDFRLIPNGGPGIETRVPLMLTAVHNRRLTLGQAVAWLSTNAAKQFELFPKKGVLLPGSDADVVIVEQNPPRYVAQARTLHQNVDYTPYEGWELRGVPRDVMAGGQWLIRDYQKVLSSPQGRFVG
ncbi:MAG: dihydropyrimidinase [Sulfobacillus benefaciens]|uniref:Dihydropyrimidinase n=1 Tax=Sulfobacillus benefaciens TaxID=453960 RepID=A0A2T2WG59_9FIRM|nr:MAG: dihydropyrimidinase [Sulfobacillus benefaciens]